MVVIAVSVCSKTRKAYFTRHFIEVKKSRIENLIAGFTSVKTTGTQHSFIEMDGVRFLYQPLDEVTVVVLTNKNSNIYRDLKVLSLLASIVTEICNCSKEAVVMEKVFEIIICFDEVISRGYSEDTHLEDVMEVLAAESIDEKLYNKISKLKEEGARAELRRKARLIKQQKKEATRSGLLQRTSELGRGLQQSMGRFSQTHIAVPGSAQPYIPLQQQATMQPSKDPAQVAQQLKEKKPAVARLAADRDPSVLQESVHLLVSELITATVTRDGNIQSMLVNGGLSLKITDKSNTNLRLELSVPEIPSLTSKTHPYIDKKVFGTQGALVLANPSRTFPVNQMLDVLKWKYPVTDDSGIPIAVNFWLSPSEPSSSVTVEYEIVFEKLQLKKVEFRIPVPPSCAPVVADHPGECVYSQSEGMIVWTISESDSPVDSCGILEFTIDADDAELLFPITVSFVSYSSYCDIKVKDVYQQGDKTPVKFSEEYLLSTEKYEIV